MPIHLHISSMVALGLQEQIWVMTAEIVRPTKPKTLLFGPWQRKFVKSCIKLNREKTLPLPWLNTDSFGNSYVPIVNNGFCKLKGTDSTGFLLQGNESNSLVCGQRNRALLPPGCHLTQEASGSCLFIVCSHEQNRVGFVVGTPPPPVKKL